MKRLLFLCTVFLIVFSCYSQEFPQSIALSFSNRDAGLLFDSMDDEIELTINNGRERLDKTVAVSKIDNFLQTLPSSKFSIVHKSDKRDVGFIIGTLQCAQDSYRINISFNKNQNKIVIQTIRIDKINE